MGHDAVALNGLSGARVLHAERQSNSSCTAEPTSASSHDQAPAPPFAHSLADLYTAANRTLPPVERLEPDDIPKPYYQMLVHENGMTPTLEKYHGAVIGLNVIRRWTRGDVYFREVVLFTQHDARPVELAAVRVNLGLLPGFARQRILEERQPLGTILQSHKVPHSNRPQAFFRIEADVAIRGALQLTCADALYGRTNTLFDLQRQPLAQTFEILPPCLKFTKELGCIVTAAT